MALNAKKQFVHIMNYENNFKEKVLQINCADHYLRKVSGSYDQYISELSIVIKKLSKEITKRKFDDLLNNKLQLSMTRFNESQYIQTACELTAMHEFISADGMGFFYEKKVTNPKDVDFSLVKEGVVLNVEVKCPSIINEEIKDNEVTTSLMTRVPNNELILSELSRRLKPSKKLIKNKKMKDNNLKDFLVSAQEKVIGAPEKDINVLIVCCDSALDMQAWREYLFGSSGLFTDNSFVPHEKFSRVDYVLLTNIYNRHYEYYNTPVLCDHWKLSSSFCLLYPNKFSSRNKKIMDCKSDFEFISSIFNNESEDFEEYLQDPSDIPDGESMDMKKILGIAWYSDKYRDKGIYQFKEPKGI